MIPELKASAARQMLKPVADERKLREAADAVFALLHRHPIAGATSTISWFCSRNARSASPSKAWCGKAVPMLLPSTAGGRHVYALN